MDNAATLQRFYDLINVGDIDGFGELLADDFVEHEKTPSLDQTKEGTKALFRTFIAAFPDLHWEVEDILTCGDKAVSRVTCSGSHEGEFMGVPPTGMTFNVQAIDIVRFGDDGLAYEHWGLLDTTEMMQQLGAL
jgi:steroid delta-isomerase-like uncharacterized protein